MDRNEKLGLVSELAVERLADSGLRVRVRGGCMTPLLEDGVAVIVHRTTLPLPGDVVVFRVSSELVAHRVLGFGPAAGSLGVVTKGDHCDRHDGVVPLDRVLGKVAVRVSLAQRWAAVLQYMRIVLSRGRPLP